MQRHISFIITVCLQFVFAGFLFSQGHNSDTLQIADSGRMIVAKPNLSDAVTAADSVEGDPLVVKKKFFDPDRALRLSSVLPGMGQIYNEQYWKVPIVYAGFIGFGWMAYYNATNYIDYLNGYSDLLNDPEMTNVNGDYRKLYSLKRINWEDENPYDYEELLKHVDYKKNYHKKLRDKAYIYFAGWYIITVLDANITAYFKEYDISDDVSLQVKPKAFLPTPELNAGVGISLSFKF